MTEEVKQIILKAALYQGWTMEVDGVTTLLNAGHLKNIKVYGMNPTQIGKCLPGNAKSDECWRMPFMERNSTKILFTEESHGKKKIHFSGGYLLDRF